MTASKKKMRQVHREKQEHCGRLLILVHKQAQPEDDNIHRIADRLRITAGRLEDEANKTT